MNWTFYVKFIYLRKSNRKNKTLSISVGRELHPIENNQFPCDLSTMFPFSLVRFSSILVVYGLLQGSYATDANFNQTYSDIINTTVEAIYKFTYTEMRNRVSYQSSTQSCRSTARISTQTSHRNVFNGQIQ